MEPYPKEIEEHMQGLYGRLPEKSRRLYAGVEALKLPHGGVSYIAQLFGCSRDTIVRGIKELGEAETLAGTGSRQSGGGRKPVLEKRPDIHEVFLRLLVYGTDKVLWNSQTAHPSCSLGIILVPGATRAVLKSPVR